jgi:hypothetical protein
VGGRSLKEFSREYGSKEIPYNGDLISIAIIILPILDMIPFTAFYWLQTLKISANVASRVFATFTRPTINE